MRIIFVFTLLLSVLSHSLEAQNPTELWFTQYKKVNRNAISDFSKGKVVEAKTFFHGYLEKHPFDKEALYGLAICNANNADSCFYYVEKSISVGLPPERYFAGPYELNNKILENEKVRAYLEPLVGQLIHGPQLGKVSSSKASFWIRTKSEIPFFVKLTTPSGKVISSSKSKTKKADEFTGISSVTGLSANTTYTYSLVIDGKELDKQYTFTTFPVENEPAIFSIGFGGCAGFSPENERMWNTLANDQLPAFLTLGDNVYIDHPGELQVHQYCFSRRQSHPGFSNFTSGSSYHAIWDDHDFAKNDKGGGPELYEPSWKLVSWENFQDNFLNPANGTGNKEPGVYHKFKIADVEIFMLDGRYYRTEPDVKEPSMLGDKQKKWLLEGLKNSQANFKVIASPVPWNEAAKPKSPDTWVGYLNERNEIFDFIEKEKIDGVLLLSSDRHRSEAWKIKREKSYDLYEFNSGRLTNIARHHIFRDALFSYNKKPSYGRLVFDTNLPDASVRYEIVDIDGQVVNSITVYKSQLMHKWIDIYRKDWYRKREVLESEK